MEKVEVTLPSGLFIPLSAEYFDRKRVIEATKELCGAQCPVILIGSGAIASGKPTVIDCSINPVEKPPV
ncbi:hypothetical protein ACKUB1_10740 [Methanospirillum stamsii]|uniref:Uncharacterized protein n=1 Tax=Methanospirillum stamsii TaxID=1277351 RepID=A0A2V2N6X9_9EURY|nr:hypothetical protein [Methanospirillum stamsii]PWR75822.1 hypothetical protein DLD82_03015 [Methanospirillum stamsii]